MKLQAEKPGSTYPRKGMNTLGVVDGNRIAWLDLSGSETAAHLLALNQISPMVCAFKRSALILRVFGKAKALLRTIQAGKKQLQNALRLQEVTRFSTWP